MCKTLNFVDCLLARGRKLQQIGRSQDALHVLTRLAKHRTLPAPIAEEVHSRLAEIYLLHHHYPRAQEHLTAALAHQPNNARYHYLLATALDLDTEGDAEKALAHYEQALKLDPHQPGYLSDFGLLAVSLARTVEGLEALERAAELAPDDPEVIGKLIEGLCQLDRAEEARSILQAALFRSSQDGGFHRLWRDFQFQRLHEDQEMASAGEAQNRAEADTGVLLPFIRLAPETLPARKNARGVRRDKAGRPASPHVARPHRSSNRRHA